MAVIERLPLMQPGSTRRNVFLGVVYLCFLPLILAVALGVLPFYLAYAVGVNRNGLADRLAGSPLGRIPTVSNKGWQAGGTVFVLVILLYAVLGAAASADPDTNSPSSNAPESVDNTPTEILDTETTTYPSTRTSVSAGATDTGPGTTLPTATAGSATATPPPTTTSISTPTTTATGPKREWTVEIVRVVDGDTLEVEFPDGHTEIVRLLGVDTPEVHVEVDPQEYEGIPDTEAGRDWLRDWGHEASEFARTQVGGKSVTIAVDPQADRRGSYGRLLVYVYVDGQNFNRQLIERGYARLYDSKFSQRDAFASAERTARENDVGLWNFEGTATATPTTALADGGVSISVVTIHEDAAGNDHENENDEYIVLKNTGSSTIDMAGWTLQDAADHTFRFPSGFTLAPGETVTIRTGSGTNTKDTLYWGSDSAIWNNNGDTIIIKDSSGNVVLTREYS